MQYILITTVYKTEIGKLKQKFKLFPTNKLIPSISRKKLHENQLFMITLNIKSFLKTETAGDKENYYELL